MTVAATTENAVLIMPGMRSRPFLGSSSIIEVECSGASLETNNALLSLSLFTSPAERVLAFVNLQSKECATSFMFASCVIDNSDTKSTKVKVLVTGLLDNDTKEYGCEVTSLTSEGRSAITKWYLTVVRLSKCLFKCCSRVQMILFT